MKDRDVIVRCSMGVFAGMLSAESTETTKIVLNARRLWYWKGAASLSQLAMEGVTCPKECKFPKEVSRIELTSPTYGFEILDLTKEARKSIDSVKIWEE